MWDYEGDTYFHVEGGIEVTFFNVTFDGFHVTGEKVRSEGRCSTPKDVVQFGTCLAVIMHKWTAQCAVDDVSQSMSRNFFPVEKASNKSQRRKHSWTSVG